jgi:hypothetical protein
MQQMTPLLPHYRLSDGVNVWANFQPAAQNTTETRGKYQFAPGQTFALYPQLGNAKTLVTPAKDLIAITGKYKKHVLGSDAYQKDLLQVSQAQLHNGHSSGFIYSCWCTP